MILTLKRIYTCKDYTIGHLYVDGSYICDTLEDTDRMLDSSMSLDQIAKIKVKGMTAIPTGRYKVLMNIVSPKYSKSKYYMNICKGRVPRLDNVPGYSGVLIHVGNTAADTEGCLLVGYNTKKGMITNSKQAFEKLYNKLKIATDIGQTIWIDVKRNY
jgi:hypothetical protein